MNRTESVPSGVRLQNLIQNHHAEILSREKGNDKFIHLYNIGTYWVAFEQSACRLNGLFPNSEISLFRVPGLPDYVVMVAVSSDEADAYFCKHMVFREEYDYKVLAVAPLAAGHYHKWHIGAVRSVLQ